MPLKTTRFRASDYMETDEQVIAYIELLLENAEPDHFRKRLRGIADSRGMTELARRAGLSRQGLYKALGEDGDPKLSTIEQILEALGLKLQMSVRPLNGNR